MGFDIVRPELIDRPGDGTVLLAQILRGENLFGREVFDKKCPTAYLGRRCCRCCHRSTPVTTRLDPREGSCGYDFAGPHRGSDGTAHSSSSKIVLVYIIC
jgi:hypothetical protein